jgi:FkbM family methyltransferase
MNFIDAVRVCRRRYSFAEMVSLLRARKTTNGSACKILDYRVKYLDQNSFQIALWEILFKGVYQFEADSDSPMILDCGANIGLATLFFKWKYPKSRILAFEADPNITAVLKDNINSNRLQGVEIHNVLLSNSEGEHVFYAGDSGSLVGSVIPGRQANHHAITVRADKLSRFIKGPIDLIKMDVEGSEFEVIQDLISSRTSSQVHTMIIEYHHKIGGESSRLAQFLKLLEDDGFEYQIAANCDPVTRKGVFQDIVIGAYRS